MARRLAEAPKWFLSTIAGACLALAVWTLALAATLPHGYAASRWALTWVGFDCALVACLAQTAWLAVRRRQAAVLWATVTAALLGCDAWFDVMTAAPADLPLSVATALGAELPLAALLLYAAQRVLVATTHRARAAEGPPDPLRRAPLQDGH